MRALVLVWARGELELPHGVTLVITEIIGNRLTASRHKKQKIKYEKTSAF